MRPLFQLEERLRLCAGFVPENARLADIGTDHAYLPVWLCRSGKIQKAIAADIGEGPLQSARDTIARYQVAGQVETRLSDGLARFAAGEVDTIVIAGMGGELMARILGDCDWIQNPEITLILQPMTAVRALRLFLWEQGFSLEKEACCREGKHVYTVIKARYMGDQGPSDPQTACFVGAIAGETEAEHAFLQKEYDRAQKERTGALHRGDGETAARLETAMQELEKRMSRWKEEPLV